MRKELFQYQQDQIPKISMIEHRSLPSRNITSHNYIPYSQLTVRNNLVPQSKPSQNSSEKVTDNLSENPTISKLSFTNFSKDIQNSERITDDLNKSELKLDNSEKPRSSIMLSLSDTVSQQQEMIDHLKKKLTMLNINDSSSNFNTFQGINDSNKLKTP